MGNPWLVMMLPYSRGYPLTRLRAYPQLHVLSRPFSLHPTLFVKVRQEHGQGHGAVPERDGRGEADAQKSAADPREWREVREVGPAGKHRGGENFGNTGARIRTPRANVKPYLSRTIV